MAKTKITLTVEDSVWKEFRKSCIDRGISASEILERFMRSIVAARQRKAMKQKPKPEEPK